MREILREMFRMPWVRSIVFGIFTAGFLVGSLTGLNQAFAASGQDCDANAVIYCGVSSIGDLSSKYNNGDGRNSAGSIQHIYNSLGISSSDMQVLDSTAKNGKVTDKGNIYFGEELVATDAMTAGRQNMSGSTQQTNQGTTFYTRPPSISFQSQSLDAYVIMKNGVFQFAIIKSCGNPVKATAKPAPAPQPKPQPAPKPQPKPTPPQPVPPQPQPNVCSGNTTNSNSGIGSQGGNCSINTTTVVEQVQAPQPTPSPPQTPSPSPSGQCDNLSISASPGNSSTPLTVQASVSYSTANGTQLKSITYDWGDGDISQPTTQTNMSHTYAQAGTYTIKASLEFNTGNIATTAASATTASTGSVGVNSNSGDNVNLNSSQNVNAVASTTTVAPAVCQASVTVSTAPAPPTPTPVTPAVTTSSAPVQTAAAPQQLVNTGPGETTGLFLITTIISAFGYRLYLRRILT